MRDTTQRLGCMKRAGLDIMDHKFYQTLDCKEVLPREEAGATAKANHIQYRLRMTPLIFSITLTRITTERRGARCRLNCWTSSMSFEILELNVKWF